MGDALKVIPRERVGPKIEWDREWIETVQEMGLKFWFREIHMKMREQVQVLQRVFG